MKLQIPRYLPTVRQAITKTMTNDKIQNTNTKIMSKHKNQMTKLLF